MSGSSYQNLPDHHEESSDDEIDSLPSTSVTTSVSPSEDGYTSDAEQEWKESLQQLELLLTMVLVPYLGKYFGRKAAYWGKNHAILDYKQCTDSVVGWAKFMTWKYPVTIEITSPKTFKAAGMIEAAATL